MDTSENPAGAPASSGHSGGKPDLEQIREWLLAQLGQRLGLEPSQIDSRRPLTEFGLDSKDAINLSRELEEFLERPLSPSLVWRYPSIEQLAEILSKGETE